MKILFFGAKSYDIKSFDAYLDKEEYKDLMLKVEDEVNELDELE